MNSASANNSVIPNSLYKIYSAKNLAAFSLKNTIKDIFLSLLIMNKANANYFIHKISLNICSVIIKLTTSTHCHFYHFNINSANNLFMKFHVIALNIYSAIRNIIQLHEIPQIIFIQQIFGDYNLKNILRLFF